MPDDDGSTRGTEDGIHCVFAHKTIEACCLSCCLAEDLFGKGLDDMSKFLGEDEKMNATSNATKNATDVDDLSEFCRD